MSALPLPLGSYKLSAPAAGSRTLVNCFVQEAPPDRPRKEPAILVRAPGIAAFAETALTDPSEVRGFTQLGATVFACVNDKLYSVSSSGVTAALTGTAISGNGPVRMDNNGTDIVVTPGNGEGFYSDGTTVIQITDPDFTVGGGGADVVFLDDYFAFRRPGTDTVINTGLHSLLVNALDVASAEGKPGNLTGLQVNNRELVMVKEASTELWYNAANPVGSPFSRSPDGFKELGCAAPMSLANQDNSPLMLATDKTVRRLQGVWQRVSQHGIESVLQRLTSTADCVAIPYTQEGHLFVAYTFPFDGRTLVLDLTTKEWHERESKIASVSLGRWRPSCVIQAYGKQLVGDSASGKIGYLDPEIHEEWGEPQTVVWSYQPIYAKGLRASHRHLRIGITPGYGTATGQGVNPMLTLFVSDNGGNTRRARPMQSIGVMGEYQKELDYWNLGESKNRVYSCEVSDPVKLFTLNTEVDVDGAR